MLVLLIGLSSHQIMWIDRNRMKYNQMTIIRQVVDAADAEDVSDNVQSEHDERSRDLRCENLSKTWIFMPLYMAAESLSDDGNYTVIIPKVCRIHTNYFRAGKISSWFGDFFTMFCASHLKLLHENVRKNNVFIWFGIFSHVWKSVPLDWTKRKKKTIDELKIMYISLFL